MHSWFERVAAFYGLTAHRMLNSVSRGLPKPKRWSDAFKVGIALTGNRKVARRLIALGVDVFLLAASAHGMGAAATGISYLLSAMLP